MTDWRKVDKILNDAKRVAIDYYDLTGKPLGITSEVGECIAAKLLQLELTPARNPGFDAKDSQGRRVEIKSRRIPKGKTISGQRLGSLNCDKFWDIVVLVILNERFEPLGLYEADKESIRAELEKPGSKARTEKGALSVSVFKRIGKQVWPLK